MSRSVQAHHGRLHARRRLAAARRVRARWWAHALGRPVAVPAPRLTEMDLLGWLLWAEAMTQRRPISHAEYRAVERSGGRAPRSWTAVEASRTSGSRPPRRRRIVITVLLIALVVAGGTAALLAGGLAGASRAPAAPGPLHSIRHRIEPHPRPIQPPPVLLPIDPALVPAMPVTP